MKEHRILVVDDNKDFADVFCDILRANKYKAESCYGGRQALEMVQGKFFDIMFLDIRMPEMDGIKTLTEVKKVRPDTVIFMMTGYSVDDDINGAIEGKAFDLIYKPFEIEKVLDLIKNTK